VAEESDPLLAGEGREVVVGLAVGLGHEQLVRVRARRLASRQRRQGEADRLVDRAVLRHVEHERRRVAGGVDAQREAGAGAGGPPLLEGRGQGGGARRRLHRALREGAARAALHRRGVGGGKGDGPDLERRLRRSRGPRPQGTAQVEPPALGLAELLDQPLERRAPFSLVVVV